MLATRRISILPYQRLSVTIVNRPPGSSRRLACRKNALSSRCALWEPPPPPVCCGGSGWLTNSWLIEPASMCRGSTRVASPHSTQRLVAPAKMALVNVWYARSLRSSRVTQSEPLSSRACATAHSPAPEQTSSLTGRFFALPLLLENIRSKSRPPEGSSDFATAGRYDIIRCVSAVGSSTFASFSSIASACTSAFDSFAPSFATASFAPVSAAASSCFTTGASLASFPFLPLFLFFLIFFGVGTATGGTGSPVRL
mmetsp:Transcript_27460/g.60808  ORF Transcript_27460/g.60808 Transcript_27460/m.60808 type:complete len:255 (-) Transcript_27460:626-1390(-)